MSIKVGIKSLWVAFEAIKSYDAQWLEMGNKIESDLQKNKQNLFVLESTPFGDIDWNDNKIWH